MGNGFPGLAVVSVIALLAALGCAALLSLQPWVGDEVAPRVGVAPGLGASLGEAVAVSPGRQLAVAPARPAAGERSGPATVGATGGEADSRPELGIAAARPVARPLPGYAPPGSPPQQVPAGSVPAAQSPSPTPAAVPVSIPASPPSSEPAATLTGIARGGGEGSPPGPIGAGAGPIGGGSENAVEVHGGGEYAFSFHFYIQPSAYRMPGEENLIMRFRSGTGGSPRFGLQLWDDGSGNRRGLWASGNAMGGERFLAPVGEGAWHEAALFFRASSGGDGFYLLSLDGQALDVGAWVSLIEPGSDSALIDTGLFRGGERVVGAADVFFGPTELEEASVEVE